jgi:hypothetical protein
VYVPGLFIAKAQVIPSEPEFDRVAKRRPPNDLDVGAVAESHLKQSASQIRIAAHGKNASAAADTEPVEAARFRRSAVIARRKVTSLLHTPGFQVNVSTQVYLVETEFQRQFHRGKCANTVLPLDVGVVPVALVRKNPTT